MDSRLLAKPEACGQEVGTKERHHWVCVVWWGQRAEVGSEELEDEMLVTYDFISYSLILRGGPYSYPNRTKAAESEGQGQPVSKQQIWGTHSPLPESIFLIMRQ